MLSVQSMAIVINTSSCMLFIVKTGLRVPVWQAEIEIREALALPLLLCLLKVFLETDHDRTAAISRTENFNPIIYTLDLSYFREFEK